MSWDLFQKNRTIAEKEKFISCYAPFNHMRIRRNGAMSPCCFSTSQKLWKKGEVGLKDYWFGSLNESYQEELMAGHLHKGCQKVCGKRISEKIAPPIYEYDYNIENRLEHALESEAWPKIFEFEISNLCNFACPMCMGELSSKHMLGRDKNLKVYDPNVFDNDSNLNFLLDEFKEFIPYLQEIRFVGGEPFAHKAFYRIADIISNINPDLEIQVCTNGSIYNKKVEKICKENNLKLSVSIDTVVPKEYEKIRVGGNYKLTFNNLQKFKINAKKVIVNSTLMSVNVENINRFFLYAIDNNFPAFINVYDRNGREHTKNWGLEKINSLILQNSIDKLKKIKNKNYTNVINQTIKLIENKMDKT